MTQRNLQLQKIRYLVKAGRRARLAESSRGPTEFFYGYQQLQAQGMDVGLIEDSELGMDPPLPTIARLFNKLSYFFGGLPVGMALSLLLASGERKLVNADVAVATTNGMGLALAMAKVFGRVQVPVLLLAMGLLPIRPSKIQQILYRLLLRHIHLVTISRAEQEFLCRLLPKQDIHYIPFGVDCGFWTPADNSCCGDYVLAIGNDLNRDWITLVDAWSIDLPPLKIVTSLPVPATPENVEVINGDWRTRVLSDEEIRKLYQGARFVVIPLHDTIQPAGQSACLQAMACGRPVILSNIAGLWDAKLVCHEKNVILVQPESVSALNSAVCRLANDQELCAQIGSNGRILVEHHFNTEIMAAALSRLLMKVLNG